MRGRPCVRKHADRRGRRVRARGAENTDEAIQERWLYERGARFAAVTRRTKKSPNGGDGGGVSAAKATFCTERPSSRAQDTVDCKRAAMC